MYIYIYALPVIKDESLNGKNTLFEKNNSELSAR